MQKPTLGTSRDRGLKRVPLEGPPTYKRLISYGTEVFSMVKRRETEDGLTRIIAFVLTPEATLLYSRTGT